MIVGTSVRRQRANIEPGSRVPDPPLGDAKQQPRGLRHPHGDVTTRSGAGRRSTPGAFDRRGSEAPTDRLRRADDCSSSLSPHVNDA
jgi:hypothetical protein